jgi:hypothetical protein
MAVLVGLFLGSMALGLSLFGLKLLIGSMDSTDRTTNQKGSNRAVSFSKR